MTTKDMMAEVRQDIKGIVKILSGNGDVGLCEQVRKNTDAVKKRPFNIKEWIVIVVGVIAFAGMVFNIIKPEQIFKLLMRMVGI